MGQLFSSLMPNIQVANIFQGLIFTFFFLFGGIFIQKGDMSVVLASIACAPPYRHTRLLAYTTRQQSVELCLIVIA
jgi:hypothetical protein